ncbi:MAG: alpha/beta fold hydrolase [Ilumatobacteraceae bacterium]
MNVPTLTLPWLPEGRTLMLPGRGETFVRVHRHADPAAPWLLLLHGWTASADVQFFTAYEGLAAHYSFVAVDHRGHGRGMRSARAFQLEDAADDAAAVVEQLGIGPVITIGYSMGGPISLHLARRHPALVRAMVVQATALEWRATRIERVRWKTVRLIGPLMRSWAYPRWLRFGLTGSRRRTRTRGVRAHWVEAEAATGRSARDRAGGSCTQPVRRTPVGVIARHAGGGAAHRDRLVLPSKQRARPGVAGTCRRGGRIRLVTLESPVAYRGATVALVSPHRS